MCLIYLYLLQLMDESDTPHVHSCESFLVTIATTDEESVVREGDGSGSDCCCRQVS